MVSAKLKVSALKTRTTHSRYRCASAKETENKWLFINII